MMLVVLAGGCTRTILVTGTPPPLKHDHFRYTPVVLHEPAPAPEPPRLPHEMRLSPPAAPEAPPHEVAWEVGGAQQPWRWIVVHHSASDTGSAAAFDAFHRKVRHWDELGYHFVIDNGGGAADGLVEVGSRWPKQKYGAHCRVGDNEEYNNFGIGICLVGNFDKRRPSAAQMASLARLVEYLAYRYNIDDRHIIGHGMVDDTRCPGRYFPFDDLFARIQADRAHRP
jgi:N-acetyl-anhydromuramyl-L-alanine amidase AmpD